MSTIRATIAVTLVFILSTAAAISRTNAEEAIYIGIEHEAQQISICRSAAYWQDMLNTYQVQDITAAQKKWHTYSETIDEQNQSLCFYIDLSLKQQPRLQRVLSPIHFFVVRVHGSTYTLPDPQTGTTATYTIAEVKLEEKFGQGPFFTATPFAVRLWPEL